MILLLVLLFTHTCLAQQYPFVHYSPKDGLVSNRARLIFQDKRGLLYIGTNGGFSVYDGQRFTNFTMENGLANPVVNDIVEMGEDSLMIIQNTTRAHWLVRGQLKPVYLKDAFCPVINKMIHASDGNYFALADEGLFRFENDHFVKVDVITHEHRDAGRNLLSGVEKNNRLFMITDPEVHQFPAPAHLVIYDEKAQWAMIDSTVTAWNIIKAADGDIFLPTTSGVRKLDDHALQEGRISYLPLPSVYHSVEKLQPYFLYFDNEKNFWYATAEGAWAVRPDGKRTLFSARNGLRVNHVDAIFQDRENSLWFIDGQSGISKLTDPQFEYYDETNSGFKAMDLYANPATDTVWFLDAVNKKVLVLAQNSKKEMVIGQNPVYYYYRLIASAGSKHWLADQFNIYRCDASWRPQKIISIIPQDKGSKGINAILPDGHGNLLVLSEEITIILQDGKKILSYPLGYFSDRMDLSPEGDLWVVTRKNHALKFRIHPENPDHYFELLKDYGNELPVMGPLAITADKQGNLWIGTGLRGVFCIYFHGDSIRGWTQITKAEGLSDNFITYLHTDPEGNIWACSRGGLDKIQRKGEHFLIENITHSQNIYQNIHKVQSNSIGERWVTTDAGVIRMRLREMKNSFRPAIQFRNIELGQKVWDRPDLTASIPYNENTLRVTVAAPSYINEKQIRFNYLLDGSSNHNWSNPSPEAMFSFVNLAPGHYTLHARATFINGRYPSTEASFSFIIHPPWWQTWWFRTLALLVIFAALILILRSYYQRKIWRQQQLAERQRAIEKERTRIASDMHDDLGSGLSSIRFLTERIKRNVFSDVTREDLNKVQETSNDLIDKMNEIIWAMNEKNDSLEDLIVYTRSYAVQYCEENGLDCKAELPEYIPALMVSGEIRRNVFLTVKECLHNIAKHAKARKVEMSMEISDGLLIRIADDGIGLSAKGGTGNGLRNMRNRIESIGGKLSLENGIGVCISMNVPLKKS